MKFFRNLAGILLAAAANAPISLVTSVLLARWLTPADRGLYAVCLAFATTLSILVQLGWPSASIYSLRSVKTSPRSVATVGLLASLTLSFVSVVGSLALEPIIRARFLDGASAVVFYLIIATIPFRLLGNLFGGISRGIDRFRYENWYSVALSAGSLAAFAFVLIARDGALLEVLVASAVAYALSTSGFVLIVLRATGLTSKIDVREAVDSLRFGLKTHFMTMATRLHERQDVFVIAYLLHDPVQIAYFAISKGAMHILDLLPVALNKAAYPQIAGLPPKEAADFTCSMVRQAVLFVAPASVALGLLAPLLLPFLYGEQYAVSVTSFLWLLPCVLFGVYDGVLGRYFNAMNNHAPFVITRTISTLVNLGLNFWWVPIYGINGSAAAACTSFALQGVLAIAVFSMASDANVRDLFRMRRSDVDPYIVQLQRLLRRLRTRA